MSIIYFLVIGLLAGWLAGRFMKGRGYGIIGNMVIGVIGSFIGGFLFGLLGLAATSRIGTLVMATVGSVVLIFFVRQLKNQAL